MSGCVLPQGFSIEVDSVNCEQWSELLQLFSDANLYQTWQYGAVRWGEDKISHLLLKSNGKIVACAQVTVFKAPVVSAGIAYLRWGPLYLLRTGIGSVQIVDSMIQALISEYVTRRRMLIRIVPNPMYEYCKGPHCQSRYESFGFAVKNVDTSYKTVMLDLSHPLDELRKKLVQKWRCDLNRAERNKLEIIVGTTVTLFDKFKYIYKEMLLRKQFDSTVDIDEFCKIQQLLPETAKMRILLCEYEGEPVAGVVFSAMGDTGLLILGATSTKGLKTKGSNLLQWKTIEWLKSNGYRYYDIAGIDPDKNPGGYHFKTGIGGQEISFHGYLEACDCLASQIISYISVVVLPFYKRITKTLFRKL